MNQDKIKEISAWLDKLKTLIDTYNERMKAALAEKPKLRHGDIRLWPSCIGIIDKSEPAMHVVWDGGFQRTSRNSESDILADSEPAGNIKDIFDDLKALSKPLEEFPTQYAGISTTWTLSNLSKSLNIIHENGCEETIVACDNIPAFILNLRRLVHTAEQEAAKCES